MDARPRLDHKLASLSAPERRRLLADLLADLEARRPGAASETFDQARQALPRIDLIAPPAAAVLRHLSKQIFAQVTQLHQQATGGVQQLQHGGPPRQAASGFRPHAPAPPPAATAQRTSRRRLLVPALYWAAVLFPAVWFVVAQMASWRARSNLSHAGETQRQLTEQLQQERAQREAHRTTLAKLDEQLTKLQAQRDALRRKLNTAPAWTGTQAGQERDDNGLKLKLCWCPPGTFTMGSPAGESGRYSDENQVSVTLSRGFWLGKYEVTQGEWQAVMGSNPSGFSSSSSQAPVETVSWDEATEFCRKLTEQEHQAGRLPADWEYRLPTEAQWEYACRAGSTTRYAFGDSESELDKYAWYYINSGSKTHSVGEKQPNGWGLHDMYGNVWEWCRDWYSYTLPGGTDAEGPATASDRVHRGGSWYISAAYCRSAPRGRDSPEDRSDDLGFRLAAVQSAR